METEKKRERTDDCDGFVSKEKYERMIKVSEVTNYTLLYTNSYLKTQHFTFFLIAEKYSKRQEEEIFEFIRAGEK